LRVRHPAVAGLFYPADPERLAATVDGMLAAAGRVAEPCPLALIAPHAGYQFSGAVAASAYARLCGTDVRRAIVLGPAHRVPLRGMALPAVDAFATPLGPVLLDGATRDALSRLPAVTIDDRPHAGEHSLETHLPFLVRTLGSDARVVPVVVGETAPAHVAALLDAALDEPGTVAVVSTDLSHYLDQGAARDRDAHTAEAVLTRDADSVRSGDACGEHPLRGLLCHAARRDLAVELLQLATSADAGADPRRVVGYGAFALYGTE
jgi:MEMO1 family protein